MKTKPNKFISSYIILFSGDVETSVSSLFYISENAFPIHQSFPLKKNNTFFYIFLIIFVALLLPSGLVPTFLAIELLKLGIVLLLKPYCS